MDAELTYRLEVVPADRETVRQIVASTGFFHPPEVDVAVELVDERLAKGSASGYEFVFAEQAGRVLGYTCYGHIAVTQASYDLYWIAVDRATQGQGIGRRLMAETERQMRARGALRAYIETSDREQYAPTRGFYERCGARLAARIADFYAPGDAKLIYEWILD